MTSNIVEKSKEKYLAYEKRHKKILDASIRLFNEKGYMATTTAEIAKKAKISEPTMYKHFQNKKDLFLACFGSIAEQLLSGYRDAYKKNVDNEIGYLKQVTEVYVDFVIQNPHKSMFIIHLLSYKDDKEIESVLKAFMEKNIVAVQKVLDAAKNKGKIKNKFNTRLLASMFVNQCFTIVALKEFINPRDFTSDTFFQQMKNMLKIE